jgi:hypothetical protein
VRSRNSEKGALCSKLGEEMKTNEKNLATARSCTALKFDYVVLVRVLVFIIYVWLAVNAKYEEMQCY